MRRHPVKRALPIAALLMLIFASNQAIGQSQSNQQACEGDVYDLCGDAIPDEDKIVACLRKQWSKVSKECRRVMASYGKGNGGKKKEKNESGAAGMGAPSGY